jgi:hypothetical protein
LSTALDQRNLDLVRDFNLDQEYIWGWVGHYVIARALSLPTELLTLDKLRKFIDNNMDLLSLQPDDALDNDPEFSGENTALITARLKVRSCPVRANACVEQALAHSDWRQSPNDIKGDLNYICRNGHCRDTNFK